MKNDYDIKESFTVADLGVNATVNFLKSRQDFLHIMSLENEKFYQPKGIDLLLTRKLEVAPYVKAETIEVKTDRYHKTGNYFFETVSNVSKNTSGCFLYTEADFLFYVFPEIEIHILPTKKVREWFLPKIDSFKEKSCTTEGKYETKGRLVPRELLITNKLARVVSLVQ